MRILHTADWHLHERLKRVSRRSHLMKRLEEIAGYLDEYRVHTMVVAGDLFSQGQRMEDLNEAVSDIQRIFKPFLLKGGTIVAISGNHDNEHVFNFMRNMLDLAVPIDARATGPRPPGRLYLATQPTVLELADPAGQSVQFVLLPYPTPTRYLNEDNTPYESLAKRNQLLHYKFEETRDRMLNTIVKKHIRSVLVSHIHVRGTQVYTRHHISESDDVIIDQGEIPAYLDYVAYGHIHEPGEVLRNTPHVRYRWKAATEPAILVILRGRTDLEAPLSQLFHQLQTHQQVKQVDRVRKNEQSDFTKAWKAALQLRRQQLDQAAKLAYTSWIRNGKIITFTLANPVPEDLTWRENAALALQQGKKTRPTSLSIGQLLGFGDREVRVSSLPAVRAGEEQPLMKLPAQGLLGLDLKKERSQLNRLDEALRTLLSGGTANKNLIDILMDLSQAVFEKEEEISTYYQSSLAEDKKRAVKKALAARDLFLLQGPPGTGKTTALAELILQILERQPDARLLITSQANVAVDHVLLKVADLAREQGIEMVRIGQEEKIGAGAEIWTIEQRQANWRATILSRTEPTLAALKKHLRELRRQRQLRQTQNPEETAALELWKTRIDELEPDLQGMEEDERRLLELARYRELHPI